MAKRHQPSHGEVTAAEAFLRTLGADWHDLNLVLAIVAWVNVATAIHHGKFHNIFQLRPGAWDKAFRSGVYNVTKGSRSGPLTTQFSKYRNETDALRALAGYLQSDKGQFGLLLSAIRHDRPKDVLYAIEYSNFDPAYGFGSTDLIYKEFNSLYIFIPGKKIPGQKPPKPKPLAPLPQVLQAPVIHPNYISAWTAKTFYDERHPVEQEVPLTL